MARLRPQLRAAAAAFVKVAAGVGRHDFAPRSPAFWASDDGFQDHDDFVSLQLTTCATVPVQIAMRVIGVHASSGELPVKAEHDEGDAKE